MQMLNEDDLNLAEMSDEELDAAWDLWSIWLRRPMTSIASIRMGVSSRFRAGSSDVLYNGHQLSPPCRYPTVLFVE